MPANSHVSVNRAAMTAALGTEAGRWGAKVGRRIENAAKDRCPVDEGRLRSSISHNVSSLPGKVKVRVGSPLKYAGYVHRGTGIYGPYKTPIVPVSAKALKFQTPKEMGPLRPGQKRPPKGKRGFVYARSVKGSPPNPFLADALETVMGPAVVRRKLD